jgi:hypothetical protein
MWRALLFEGIFDVEYSNSFGALFSVRAFGQIDFEGSGQKLTPAIVFPLLFAILIITL